VPIEELCRKHGLSEASAYLWRRKLCGMDVSNAKRLKALERENRELQRSNEILRNAAAFFAQAELDRRGN
jgi:putative transposase